MIVRRSMHPDWLSNTYLVVDEQGGRAIVVDAGAPVEPIFAAATELGVRVTHVLLTHEHHDHTTHVVALQERFEAEVLTPGSTASAETTIECGALRVSALDTPGHCDPHLAWVVEHGDELAIFTGDTLFAGTVGGTVNGGADGLARLRASIEAILDHPGATRLYPGHTDDTTVERELAENAFVRAWRAGAPVEGESVQVAGTDAQLLLEGADYDGGTKAWVRFGDGREAIVGGSMLTRANARA